MHLNVCMHIYLHVGLYICMYVYRYVQLFAQDDAAAKINIIAFNDNDNNGSE
jgi:hypothetical protein